jgi:ribose transport system ATP-binding protein
LRPRIFKEQLAPFLEGIGISIPADAYIEELTDFERVIVEVLKSVVAGCRLIVLRDISADICETELEKIHLLLKHYAKEGISFLYIDYHFEELQQICDKVALMSNGRIIKILQGESLTPESLYAYTGAYIGKVRQQIRLHEPGKSKGSFFFQVRNTSGSIHGSINGLSFTVAPGECVVLQNVDVQIFGELLSLLSGEALPENGEILLDGKPAGLDMGGNIAVIQELPTKTMIFNELSYFDNLCFLLDRRLPEIWRDNSVREGVRREYAEILGHDVFDMRVDTLSEVQKYHLVYARVVMQNPKVVFCVQPFRQADMELRMHIMEHMQMLLDKGMALVILTVNLADSLSLADKLIRIRRDKPEEVYLRNEFSTMPVNAPWIELYRESR